MKKNKFESSSSGGDHGICSKPQVLSLSRFGRRREGRGGGVCCFMLGVSQLLQWVIALVEGISRWWPAAAKHHQCVIQTPKENCSKHLVVCVFHWAGFHFEFRPECKIITTRSSPTSSPTSSSSSCTLQQSVSDAQTLQTFVHICINQSRLGPHCPCY